MRTTKCQKFKGEIENYLRNGQNNFDVKIDRALSSLKFKSWLCKSNIVKRDGYPSAHIILILFILPLLRLKTVNSFVIKNGINGLWPAKTLSIDSKHGHIVGDPCCTRSCRKSVVSYSLIVRVMKTAILSLMIRPLPSAAN